MRGRGAWRSAGAVALLCAATWCASPAALAAHVQCGDSVTSDTTLDSDLLNCPGNGLVIRASGVTLDLGGHLVDGTGGGLGIAGALGVSGVTVEHGAVGQFHDAVVLSSGADYVVRDVTVSQSHDGVLLFSVTRALVEDVSAWGNNGSGITAPVSTDVTITGNHVFDNAAGVGGVAIGAVTLTHNLIERNTFYGMRFGQLTGSIFDDNVVRDNGDHGILLEDGSTGNRLSRNLVSGTNGDGVFLSEDSGVNVLSRNRSDRNADDGFEIDGPGATLSRNSATRNADLGFEAPRGAAVADRNKAHHNGNRLQCAGIPCH